MKAGGLDKQSIPRFWVHGSESTVLYHGVIMEENSLVDRWHQSDEEILGLMRLYTRRCHVGYKKSIKEAENQTVPSESTSVCN